MLIEDYIDLEDFLQPEENKEPKCECGAHHTINPNLHSDWCPLFIPPMSRK